MLMNIKLGYMSMEQISTNYIEHEHQMAKKVL